MERVVELGPVEPGEYVLRLKWEVTDDERVIWVNFWLYETTAVDDDGRHYQRKDARVSPDLVVSFAEAEDAASGFVKWDGCTQFEMARVHVDGRIGLDKLCQALQRARLEAARLMHSTGAWDLSPDEYSEEELGE